MRGSATAIELSEISFLALSLQHFGHIFAAFLCGRHGMKPPGVCTMPHSRTKRLGVKANLNQFFSPNPGIAVYTDVLGVKNGFSWAPQPMPEFRPRKIVLL